MMNCLKAVLPISFEFYKSELVSTLLSAKCYLIWLKTVVALLENTDSKVGMSNIENILKSIDLKKIAKMEECAAEAVSSNQISGVQTNEISSFMVGTESISSSPVRQKGLTKPKRKRKLSDDENKENEPLCSEEILLISSPEISFKSFKKPKTYKPSIIENLSPNKEIKLHESIVNNDPIISQSCAVLSPHLTPEITCLNDICINSWSPDQNFSVFEPLENIDEERCTQNSEIFSSQSSCHLSSFDWFQDFQSSDFMNELDLKPLPDFLFENLNDVDNLFHAVPLTP